MTTHTVDGRAVAIGSTATHDDLIAAVEAALATGLNLRIIWRDHAEAIPAMRIVEAWAQGRDYLCWWSVDVSLDEAVATLRPRPSGDVPTWFAGRGIHANLCRSRETGNTMDCTCTLTDVEQGR